jgi:hypothetical protein
MSRICIRLRGAAFFRAALPVAACALALCGCLVPERYMASVRIERDGSYKFSADGTAVEPKVLRAMRNLAASADPKAKPEEAKKQKDEALAPLLEEIGKLQKDSRVLAMNSIGDGRVRFSVVGKWRIDTSLIVLRELTEPLAYHVEPDGSVLLILKDAKPGRAIQALGLETSGDIAITPGEGVEVLAHNAARAPGSPNGAYRWHIDKTTTQAPYLRVRFSGPAPAPEPKAEQSQKKLAHH